jgi:hypothetical protein
MDSIQGWVLDKLCFGPLKPEEMPFEGYTVNPIVVKLKPTGAARVCINMSAPYPKPWHQEGEPSAVNSGVNKAEFPACMGSTKSFATSLIKAGCPAEMAKIDWNQGKHRRNDCYGFILSLDLSYSFSSIPSFSFMFLD